MPYDVSSWFLDQTARPSPPVIRRFTIGTSDYTERVTQFPSFKRTANEIRSVSINLPLANADGALNHFYQETYKIPNTCTLEIGITLDAPAGDYGFLKHTGQTGSFTPGNVVFGYYPGSSSPSAAGTVVFDGEDVLYLSGLTSGTFVDGMIVCESSYGGELVVGGDCASDSFACDFANWVYDAENDEYDHTPGLGYNLYQDCGVEKNKFYKSVFTVKNYSAGGVSAVVGSMVAGARRTADGTYIDIIMTDSSVNSRHNFQSTLSDFAGSVDDISLMQILNATLADGSIVTTSDEYIKVFTGFLKDIQYSEKKCTLKIKDRLWDFYERKVGDPDAHVDIGSTIPSDIAWTLCTCYGGLSGVASTSNPDIDYAKFLTWAAQFSQDNILMTANYQGVTVAEALNRLGRMTDSAVWIEGDGKLNFVKFVEPSSLDITFTRDEFADIMIDVESLRVVNRHYTNFDYSVTSEYWTKTVFAQSSLSVDSFGLYEQQSKDETIWYVDSVGALGLSQRKVNLLKDPPKRFQFRGGLYGVHKQLGETVRLVDSFYEITSASGWRLVEAKFDTNRAQMQFNLDEATVMNAFYLDVSDLDGDDLLV